MITQGASCPITHKIFHRHLGLYGLTPVPVHFVAQKAGRKASNVMLCRSLARLQTQNRQTISILHKTLLQEQCCEDTSINKG